MLRWPRSTIHGYFRRDAPVACDSPRPYSESCHSIQLSATSAHQLLMLCDKQCQMRCRPHRALRIADSLHKIAGVSLSCL